MDYAVITVPSYFNDKQKDATRTAAALAGLKVRRLLPEPTAAAISFGVDEVRGDDATTVLVFDFGGGTFDLSVLTISGGQFIEQGKGGDMWLGGDDIDRLITDYVLAETAKTHRIEDMTAFIEGQEEKQKNRFLGELKQSVERAKIRLSQEEKAFIEIPGVLKKGDMDSVDVDVELRKDRLNALIAPIVDRTVSLASKLLEEIHFTPDLIDRVLLVGGSSMISCLIEAMEQLFGEEKVLVHERPMLAIAEGAAILSHRLADTYECPQCGRSVTQSETECPGCEFDLETFTIEDGVFDIVHSAAHDYYIHLENNERHLFVEKNTPLPCEKTEIFNLVHPEQKLIHMKFFNIVNEREESIGDLWLGMDAEEPPESKGPLRVEITLGVDENNLIEVTAAMKEHPDIKLSKTLSRGRADEKLFLSLEETIQEANRKEYNEYVIIDLTHRSISTIRDINRVVDPGTGELDEGLYERAERKIDKARKMAAEGYSSRTTIYYGRSVLDDFGRVIPEKKRKLIRRRIENLERMDEEGTHEEDLKALQELEDSLEDLGAVSDLMEIQKAGEFCMESDPARAPKFFRAFDNIINAIETNDTDRAGSMLDEIMPEALQVVDTHETRSGVIYKDIRK